MSRDKIVAACYGAILLALVVGGIRARSGEGPIVEIVIVFVATLAILLTNPEERQ